MASQDLPPPSGPATPSPSTFSAVSTVLDFFAGSSSPSSSTPSSSTNTNDVGDGDENVGHGGNVAGSVGSSSFINSAFTKQVAANVAAEALESGKQRAQSTLNMYARIDFLRPYFDTEPREVLNRLLFSLIPRKTSTLLTEYPDLYGGTMIAFTLASILFWGLQMSDISLNSGSTRLGTALAVSFSYWMFTSGVFFVMTFLFNLKMTLFQIVSVTGYSMFGLCLSLIIHCTVGGWWDLIAVLVFGGASAATLAFLLFCHCPNRQHGAIYAGTAVLLHLSFLLYMTLYYTSIHSHEIPSFAVVDQDKSIDGPVDNDDSAARKKPAGKSPFQRRPNGSQGNRFGTNRKIIESSPVHEEQVVSIKDQKLRDAENERAGGAVQARKIA